jgi:DNA polymerase III subunit gamma/tau
MLNSFTVVGVEGTPQEVVVVIQAAYELHHKYVQEGDRAKDVDWALSTEFKQQCRVRLLAPGTTLPSSLVFESSSFSLNVAANEAPPQAARRERPSASSKPAVTGPEGRLDPPQEPHVAGDQTSSVAKKNMVRENTSTGSTLETAKQKASSDPVVQEVIRTFAAKIVDIRLK